MIVMPLSRVMTMLIPKFEKCVVLNMVKLKRMTMLIPLIMIMVMLLNILVPMNMMPHSVMVLLMMTMIM